MKPSEIIGPDSDMQFSLSEATRRIKQLEEIMDVLAERLEAIDLQTLMLAPSTKGIEIKSVSLLK